ncbi:MAG TPA: hypothetical protein VFK14_00060 [Solirubrobacterales bacterium]|nr:hypothetical protein [Solirubrobacterales bacterium]
MSAVAAPPRQPEKLASHASDCPLCPAPIDKGDPIKLTMVSLGWAHTECANDYFEVYPPDESEEAA